MEDTLGRVEIEVEGDGKSEGGAPTVAAIETSVRPEIEGEDKAGMSGLRRETTIESEGMEGEGVLIPYTAFASFSQTTRRRAS